MSSDFFDSLENLNNHYPATIIAFEGSDCSFKTTNIKKAYDYLTERSGKNVIFLKFPVYKDASSIFVRNYLAGEYDTIYKANKDIKQWKANSLFYALDRFDAFREYNIWNALQDENNILLFDRYCISNIMFQTAWLYGVYEQYEKDRVDRAYELFNNELLHDISYLRNLEQGTLGLPMEDFTIVMRSPVDKIMEVLSHKEEKDYIENNLNMIYNMNSNIDNVINTLSDYRLWRELNDNPGKVNICQDSRTITSIWTTDDDNEFLSEDALFDKVKNHLDDILGL